MKQPSQQPHLNAFPNKTAEFFWSNLEIKIPENTAWIHMQGDDTMHPNGLQNIAQFDRIVRDNYFRMNAVYVYVKGWDNKMVNFRLSECSDIRMELHDEVKDSRVIGLPYQVEWRIDIRFKFLTLTVLREDEK